MRSWTASCSCARPGRRCRRPSGSGRHEQADYAISEWVHFFRGEPRVKRDIERVTEPTSPRTTWCSSAIRRATRSTSASRPGCRSGGRASGVVAGGETFSKDHAPVFIFPNPLNPKKYVVINSGFTFHDQSNNDMQSPKLPDWAVVDITKPGNNYRYLPCLRRIAGILRRGLEAQRADEAVTRNRISISFQAASRARSLLAARA